MRPRTAIPNLLPSAAAVAVCMLAAPLVGHPTSWLVPTAIALTVAAAMLSGAVAWSAYRHHRLSRRLSSMAHPAVVGKVEVRELPGVAGAFVAGLRRPQIFCSPRLRAELEPDELRAVLLHERHHQLDRAPAKLVVLQAVTPFVRAIRIGRAWLARRVAALEIAADRHAIAYGSSRAALARALLKLAPLQPGNPGIAFSSAVELRLRALLDGERPDGGRPAWSTWLVAPAAAVAICALAVLIT
jgi:Zn-dependent protease with chaperone function